MALSEQEEFELLSLERERATAPAADVKPNRFQEAAARIARGLVMGGPLGAATAGVGLGMEGLDKASEAAGGAVTDTLAGVVPAEVAGALGAATQVGIPSLVGGVPGGAVGKGVLEAGAKKLMHSALKPSAQSQMGGVNSDAAKAIQTMLDEGVNVSTGGALKMRNLINKLQGEVNAKIASSEGIVQKGAVYEQVREQLQKFYRQVNPNSDLKAIRTAWEEFMAHPLVAEVDRIPVQTAQALKQGTYRILADKYAKGGLPAIENEASTQAQMAMARGLRKGIEDAVPGVGELNAREAALINALELAEKRAGMAGNRDIAGIAWLAQHPAAAAAMLADRSPAFKSAMARLLYRARNVAPAGAGAATAAAVTEGQKE